MKVFYMYLITSLNCFCSPGLREEDNSDRADEYIVTLLGRDGHLSEVGIT